jgi:hypothetical protein
MNIGNRIYVIDTAKVDSLIIPQAVLIYPAEVEDYSKEEVVITLHDTKGRKFIKTIPKDRVFESYQLALERVQTIIKDIPKESDTTDDRKINDQVQ